MSKNNILNSNIILKPVFGSAVVEDLFSVGEVSTAAGSAVTIPKILK